MDQKMTDKFNKQDKEIIPGQINQRTQLIPLKFHTQLCTLLSLPMNESSSKTKLSEQQFEDKLNLIVKIIKLKQQICLQTIQHLQLILLNSEQLSTQIFLHDQMSKHKIFLDKVTKKFQDSKNKEKTLQLFSNNPLQLIQNQKALVRRVSARILQLFQSFNQKVQKYSYFQKEISTHYRLIKPKFLKQIGTVDRNGSNMNCIFQIYSMFFIYLESKFNDQCKKLNKIIELIENGQIASIQSAFICDHCKQLEKKATPRVEAKSPKHNLQSTKNLEIKHSKQHDELRYFSKEKQKITQKLKMMRQEAKNKEIIKKQKTKFASKYFSLYQSAMDIHKGHLMEDLTFIDQKEHRQKILTQMQSRNRYNSAFIKEYITVCDEKQMLEKTNNLQNMYLEKQVDPQPPTEPQQAVSPPPIEATVYEAVKIFDTVIQKDASIQSSSPYPQQPNSLPSRQIIEVTKSHTIGIQNEEKIQMKSFRITNPNKKSSIPTPKSNPNLFSIKQIGPISQSYNFVKINMKNGHHQRSRLPDISNRLFSLDQKQKSAKAIDKLENLNGSNNLLTLKTNLNKPKDLKKEQRKIRVQQTAKIDIPNSKICDKIDKIEQEPITSSLHRNSLIKRAEPGNKLFGDNYEKGSSLKSLDINYSSSISKKIRNFCECVSIKEVHL